MEMKGKERAQRIRTRHLQLFGCKVFFFLLCVFFFPLDPGLQAQVSLESLIRMFA